MEGEIIHVLQEDVVVEDDGIDLEIGGFGTKARHFPSNLYPYPNHNHQQQPMPTHAIQIAPMYSKIV